MTCPQDGHPNEEGTFMQVRVADESQMTAAMASDSEQVLKIRAAVGGKEELAKELQRIAGAESSCLTAYPGLTDLAEALRGSLGQGSNSSLAKAQQTLEKILSSHQRDVDLVQGLGQKFLACTGELLKRTRLAVQKLFTLSKRPRSECGSTPCPSGVRESYCAETSIACGMTDCSGTTGGEHCEIWIIGNTSGDLAAGTEKTQRCDTRTQLFEGFCAHYADVTSSCERFEACWKAAELHVLATVEAVQLSVSRRKCAYTATKRMICHIDIISDVATFAAAHSASEPPTPSIKNCAELSVDTSILNITFPQDRTKKASCDQPACFLSTDSVFTMSCDPDGCRAVAASRASDRLLEIQSSEAPSEASKDWQGRCWFSGNSSEPVLRECPADCFEMPQAETTQVPSHDSHHQSYYAGRRWRWKWRPLFWRHRLGRSYR
ncbi:unnamed protein product [Symbiodinium sp. CCMP2456]|nr:unnamed protein product [Symbiodinium sp. CCMP2456]